jgi:hypothetical protein
MATVAGSIGHAIFKENAVPTISSRFDGIPVVVTSHIHSLTSDKRSIFASWHFKISCKLTRPFPTHCNVMCPSG